MKIMPRLTLGHLWPATVLIGVFVLANTYPIRPNDFWWHLALGRQIVAAGRIPAVDVYSYTMTGQPYPSYQMFWLADIGLYALFSAGGPALVIFAHSLLLTAAYGLLLWAGQRLAHDWRAAALATLFSAALGFDAWNVRPQTLSFLLGAVFTLAIYSYRQRQRALWLACFPLGMLVWVNSHGSFPLGLALPGIWLGEEAWRAWAARARNDRKTALDGLRAPGIALLASLLACLANPRGLELYRYPQALLGDPTVQSLVTEWAPPSLSSLPGSLFIPGIFLAAVLLAVSPRRPDFFQLATFAIFGLLGLHTTRGVAWFGLAMAPILSVHLSGVVARNAASEKRPAPPAGAPILNLVLLALLAGLALLSLPWFKEALPYPGQKAGLISKETPVEATRFLLNARPPGELFHEMGFGSYLIWAAFPNYRVFADPRIELYPGELWRDYLLISNAIPGWEERLERYGVHTLLLSPARQAALIQAARDSGRWRLIYQDQAALIFTRLPWGQNHRSTFSTLPVWEVARGEGYIYLA